MIYVVNLLKDTLNDNGVWWTATVVASIKYVSTRFFHFKLIRNMFALT